MSFKIQINSLQAVERLIGNDDEMEIEVRRSIIEAFGKGFVKSVHNNHEIKQEINHIAQKAIESINELAEKEIGKYSGGRYYGKFELNDKTQNKIIQDINAMIDNLIQNEVTKRIKSLENDIEKYVNKRATDVVERRLKSWLDTQLGSMISEIIKHNEPTNN